MKSVIFIAVIMNFFFWALAPKTTGKPEPLCERYEIPSDYHRPFIIDGNFADYLCNLPLKEYGSEVKYFNGSSKLNSGIYDSVIDMDIDPVDLQQCADAVMRLRAEYLYENKAYDKISFNFLSDGKPRKFIDYTSKRDYKSFRRYMRHVFSYANTASLKDELSPVSNKDDIQPGDVFIVKGNPYGHAIIVMDVAVNINSGKKQFILAQSYMPAQETQILLNPNADDKTVWYTMDSDQLITPEWTFEWTDLHRF